MTACDSCDFTTHAPASRGSSTQLVHWCFGSTPPAIDQAACVFLPRLGSSCFRRRSFQPFHDTSLTSPQVFEHLTKQGQSASERALGTEITTKPSNEAQGVKVIRPITYRVARSRKRRFEVHRGNVLLPP